MRAECIWLTVVTSDAVTAPNHRAGSTAAVYLWGLTAHRETFLLEKKKTLIRLKCVSAQVSLVWCLCFQRACYKTSDNWVAPKVVPRQEWVKIRMLSNIMEPLRFNVLVKPLFCSIPFRPTTFFRGEIMELGICSPCERRVMATATWRLALRHMFFKMSWFLRSVLRADQGASGEGGPADSISWMSRNSFSVMALRLQHRLLQNWAPIKDKLGFFLNIYVKFSSSLPHLPHWYSFSGNLVVCCSARTSFVRSAFRLPEETSIKALPRMKSLCTRIILPLLSMDLKTDTL